MNLNQNHTLNAQNIAQNDTAYLKDIDILTQLVCANNYNAFIKLHFCAL